MAAGPPFAPSIREQSQEQGPLSCSQESRWFLQQLDPAGNAYNLSSLYGFTGGVNRFILEQALNSLHFEELVTQVELAVQRRNPAPIGSNAANG